MTDRYPHGSQPGFPQAPSDPYAQAHPPKGWAWQGIQPPPQQWQGQAQGPRQGPPPPWPEQRQTSASQPKKSKAWLIEVLIVLGLLLLAGGGTAGVIAYEHLTKQAVAKQQEAAITKAKEELKDKASQLALDFFTALSKGQASKAYDMFQNVSATSLKLSDETYAAMVNATPIADVAVKSLTETNYGIDVAVSYTSSGMPKQATLTVVEHKNAGLKIGNAPKYLKVSVPSGVMLSLYDQKINQTDLVATLPGKYEFLSANPHLLISSDPVLIDPPKPYDGFQESWLTFKPTMVPSEQAKQTVLDTAITKLKQCSTAKELAPNGCPWELTVNDSETVDHNSIKYAFTEADWAETLKVEDNESSQLHVTVDLSHLTVKFTGTGTRGSQQVHYDATFSCKGSFVSDLTKETLTVETRSY